MAGNPPRLLDVDRGTSRPVRGRLSRSDGGRFTLTERSDGGPFTLGDRRTGARHRIARPTPDLWSGSGLPSPDGRLLAVEFVDLSWSRVKGQVSDIWLLDLRGRRWRRLPGMPLITAVKFMSMAWAGDGRLVLVGDFDRFGEALAVWRPGQDHLAVRRIDLPSYDGSDSFAVWPAARP